MSICNGGSCKRRHDEWSDEELKGMDLLKIPALQRWSWGLSRVLKEEPLLSRGNSTCRGEKKKKNKKQVIAWKLENLRIEREIKSMACEWAEGKESERSNRLTGGVTRCCLEKRHPVSCCSHRFTAFESSLELGEIVLGNQFPHKDLLECVRVNSVRFVSHTFQLSWEINTTDSLNESAAIQHTRNYHQFWRIQYVSNNPPTETCCLKSP